MSSCTLILTCVELILTYCELLLTMLNLFGLRYGRVPQTLPQFTCQQLAMLSYGRFLVKWLQRHLFLYSCRDPFALRLLWLWLWPGPWLPRGLTACCRDPDAALLPWSNLRRDLWELLVCQGNLRQPLASRPRPNLCRDLWGFWCARANFGDHRRADLDITGTQLCPSSVQVFA